LVPFSAKHPPKETETLVSEDWCSML
jgi:hypothetical protein